MDIVDGGVVKRAFPFPGDQDRIAVVGIWSGGRWTPGEGFDVWHYRDQDKQLLGKWKVVGCDVTTQVDDNTLLILSPCSNEGKSISFKENDILVFSHGTYSIFEIIETDLPIHKASAAEVGENRYRSIVTYDHEPRSAIIFHHEFEIVNLNGPQSILWHGKSYDVIFKSKQELGRGMEFVSLIQDITARLNEFGLRNAGILALVGIFFALPLISSLGWIYNYWQKISVDNMLERVQKEKAIVEDQFNKINIDIERGVYTKFFEELPIPFDLGLTAKVESGTTLRLEGLIQFPFPVNTCPHYWLVFLDKENRVWPKVFVKNTGSPAQRIDSRVAIPATFREGRVVLACVSQKQHDEFAAWLSEGRDTPMWWPKPSGLVLATEITIL